MSMRGRRGQRVEHGGLERQMTDFGTHAERGERSPRSRTVATSSDRRPTQSSPRGGSIPTWPIRIGLPIALMRRMRRGVDVEDVLVEDQVGSEILDLGQQDRLGLRDRVSG